MNSTAVSAELQDLRAEIRRERLRLRSALEAEATARRAAKQVEHRLDLLKGISEVALADYDLSAAFDEILQRLRDGLPADSATLLLRDPERDALRVRASRGAACSEIAPSVRIGQGLCGRVAAQGRSMTMADVASTAADHAPVRDHPSSAAAVPLLNIGRVVGVLQVGRAEGRQFDTEELHRLAAVSARLVAVLDRQRLLELERQARARAEAAVRQRDEVLAIVAHDLRNPLNRISLSASRLRESCGAATDPRAWELMQRGVKDMDRLIEDLLDVSRMESGALQLDRSEVPLLPLLTELQEAFTELARSKGVELACRTDPASLSVLADRRRLMQALSNLLDNALRLTPSGGKVTVMAQPASGHVEFAVSDTGPGVPAEQLPHLFDRFWQGARARRGGAGLGLAIVKGIVEAHGGRVFAESTPGAGATFHFWIPAPA